MFFKLQFMSRYVQGLLPSIFNNVWLKRESWRADNFSFSLHNSKDLFIPTALLSQTDCQPYFLFPRLWSEFDVPAIKIIRNVTEFNNALKAHLLNILPSVVNCTRLFCPSCSNIEAVLWEISLITIYIYIHLRPKLCCLLQTTAPGFCTCRGKLCWQAVKAGEDSYWPGKLIFAGVVNWILILTLAGELILFPVYTVARWPKILQNNYRYNFNLVWFKIFSFQTT